MSWQQVAPRYVRQDQPGLQAQWYTDWSGRGGGELMVWLDPDGRVAGFQLTHEEWPSLRHYVAHWTAGSRVRIGEVDEGAPRQHGIGRKPAPILRFGAAPSPEAAACLLAYFRRNAGAVDPAYRQIIAAVLSEATGTS